MEEKEKSVYDCNCKFKFEDEKQKTCLTEKEKDELSLKIAFHIQTIDEQKEKIIHAISLTEKAIMKKAVPIEKIEKAFEGLELAGTVGWLKREILGDE